ncbi:MAG TPA: sigma-70 family RNA polymerase sigma factor, partial [Planctomycetota bacterium]|nr:sigma-70 family RNA polymerase sigma factor [Planctomycetota bacterium]
MSPAPYPALHELLADARWVRSLARTLTQNAQDADDLAQDACLVALRQPPPHTDNLRGWFQRVLTNLVRQHARSRARRLRREQTRAGGGGHGAATDDLVERAATHRSVVDAVLALEQPYRDTILLRFFEDLPPRAIAARMAVPVATVHSRLQRGCASVRAQLDRSSGPRPWRAALLPLPVATPLPSLGVLLMNAKIASVAATVVVGTAALWYALQSGGTADVPVQTDEVAAARPGTKTAAAPAPEAGAPTDRVRATPPAADAAARPAPLPDRRAIAGRVVDAEGRSAADVQMAFADARARSDRAGAFTLETTDHERGLVRTDDPRWQTVLSSVVPDGATPPRALVVAAPTLTLAGLVREAGGPAVAGALLQIAWPADLRSRIAEITDACTEETVTARTGSDGAFHLTGAAVRSAALVVTAEGFVPQRLTLPERDDTSLHVELERLSAKPGTIQGQ